MASSSSTHQKQFFTFSTLLFFFTILHFPVSSSAQDCPYPCYPPPTGPGNTNQPVTTTPPAPPAGGAAGGATYSPPAFYGPPAGVVPVYTPPSGDGFSSVTNYDQKLMLTMKGMKTTLMVSIS
ncbi:OLC1v1032014C1 [Oldenlandia corymbosa var. corymbosa]|uniref:OLC1v1032014C1 n=1 Tax=Oldenlandia corymbosa var. corymbosa TaxID=529605 RepID=A0AAV1CK87_OLDCO|nr:OLC1v1032014C1 [Oldenlandia corymbosa var. corymbosa]